MKIKKIIKTKKTLLKNLKTEFPKYTASLMNLSNSTGNLTSKKNIGPLHEYFEEFKKTYKGSLYNINQWKKFYKKNKNGKELIDIAIEKNLLNIKKFKLALDLIDKKLMTDYINDLVFKKTFIGMSYEFIAVSMLAQEIKKNEDFIKKSSTIEESKGIDYWIDDISVQVKPIGYNKNKKNQNTSSITIYYEKIDENKFSIKFDQEKLKKIIEKNNGNKS